jgi:hypothetical protein
MKNQVLSNVRTLSKSIIAPAALVFMLIASAVPSTAQSVKESAETVIPVKVTYLGRVDLHPVFQIDIDNLKGEDFYVTLKEEDGTLLYSDKFSDQKYSRKFRFETFDPIAKKVTLTLRSKKDKKTQALQFGNVVTTVEDVVVTRANYY